MFSICLAHFALLDPDPDRDTVWTMDPWTPLNPDPIRIRIRIHNTANGKIRWEGFMYLEELKSFFERCLICGNNLPPSGCRPCQERSGRLRSQVRRRQPPSQRRRPLEGGHQLARADQFGLRPVFGGSKAGTAVDSRRDLVSSSSHLCSTEDILDGRQAIMQGVSALLFICKVGVKSLSLQLNDSRSGVIWPIVLSANFRA